MAYLGGYEYDFFVSYASVDNKPVSPEDRGWVDALIGTLVDELARRIGRREAFTFWMDKQNLRGNQEANEHIPDQVKRSALFLAVLSPGYAASTFCQLELETFIASVGGTAERLFVVYKEHVNEREQTFPDAFRRPVKYEFWFADKNGKPRFLGLPLPNPNDPDDRKLYYPKILDIRNDIAEKLNDLKLQNAKKPSLTGASDRGPTVLLSEVTPQPLKERRDDVKRYFEQAGIRTLPAGSYFWLTGAELEHALTTDLSQCDAFVQLLDAEPDRLSWEQLQAAKRRNCRILQWRSPDLNLRTDVSSPEQRALLEAIEAMPIDDFKQKVARIIAPPPPANGTNGGNRNGAGPGRPSFIFINCDATDTATADRIGKDLGSGYDWERPPYERKPKTRELRQAIENNLIECDGLFIVQGENPAWVFDQLQLFRKLRQRRTKDARVLAVVQAGDNPVELRGINLAGLRTIRMDEVAAALSPGAAP
jgi:hypothetical protein